MVTFAEFFQYLIFKIRARSARFKPDLVAFTCNPKDTDTLIGNISRALHIENWMEFARGEFTKGVFQGKIHKGEIWSGEIHRGYFTDPEFTNNENF